MFTQLKTYIINIIINIKTFYVCNTLLANRFKIQFTFD